MLLTIAIVLLILWLLGMVATSTLGGALHILLILAIVFLLIRVIRGEPV
ncbi:MAG: lmo0937 family membrane protein [Acidobacteria bacterium]|nr:lmo0937 family membrane protein [Acidobacteriota bacterium]